MKIIQRSFSYQKPQKSNVALPRRQVSVPSTIHQQMLNDKELFPSVISKDALECIKDAAGCFSRVNTMMLRSPVSIKRLLAQQRLLCGKNNTNNAIFKKN